MSIDYSLSVIWIPPKHFTCPLDKFRTEFTSPTAKSTRHGLLSSTFFAYCKVQYDIMLQLKFNNAFSFKMILICILFVVSLDCRRLFAWNVKKVTSKLWCLMFLTDSPSTCTCMYSQANKQSWEHNILSLNKVCMFKKQLTV